MGCAPLEDQYDPSRLPYGKVVPDDADSDGHNSATLLLKFLSLSTGTLPTLARRPVYLGLPADHKIVWARQGPMGGPDGRSRDKILARVPKETPSEHYPLQGPRRDAPGPAPLRDQPTPRADGYYRVRRPDDDRP